MMMQATYSCRWWVHGSRGCTVWEVACRTGPTAVWRWVVVADPHVAERMPGSRGELVGAHWELVPQAVAADWEAYQVGPGRGALHQGAVVAVTLGAGCAVQLVASPTHWSPVVGPCGLVSVVDPWALQAVAGALLEGACATGSEAAVPFVGAQPLWAVVGPAGWLATVAGDRSVEAVAAGEVGAPGDAPGGVGVPPASSAEVGSCVRAHLGCTEEVVEPVQSAVAPLGACVPDSERGGSSRSVLGVKGPEDPAGWTADPCRYRRPSGMGHLSSDRTSPCSDPCGAHHDKTHHIPVTVMKLLGWACGSASRNGSDVDDCTSLPPGSDHGDPSWATFP